MQIKLIVVVVVVVVVVVAVPLMWSLLVYRGYEIIYVTIIPCSGGKDR